MKLAMLGLGRMGGNMARRLRSAKVAVKPAATKAAAKPATPKTAAKAK